MHLNTHSEIEDLGGGRFCHVQYIKPIAFERSGSLRRITSLLAGSGDPNLPIGCDELLTFRIREKLSGNAPVLHVGHGADHIRMTPLGTANVSAVVRENVVSFPGAWSGADYVLTLGGHFVRKAIPLRMGHPSVFRFRIDEHSGFDPVALTVGRLRILQPMLEPPIGSDKLAIPLQWLVTQQGGRWVLTVTLPPGDYAGWTLDPTLTLQPGAADGIDTLVDVGAPNTNYGTNATWAVGSTGVILNVYRELAKFDLASIPAGSTIIAATLTLTLFQTLAAGANFRISRILAANSAWGESTATWNKVDGVNNWAGSAGAIVCLFRSFF